MPPVPSPAPADPFIAPTPVERMVAGAEWLLTDGRGGYASGSVADLALRRYHGLWIVRGEAEATRYMVVAGLHERIAPREGGDGGFASLLHAHWRGQERAHAPEADVAFALHPLPRWTFASVDGRLERTVALRRISESVPEGGAAPPLLLVRYRNLGDGWLRLAVRPLLGWCNVDHLPPVDETFDGAVAAQGASWGFRPTALLPTLWLTAEGLAAFRSEPVWYRDCHYAIDRERGYDHHGNRWSPGELELLLPPRGEATLAFALGAPCDDPADQFDAVAARAMAELAPVLAADEPLPARLARSAGDFLYRARGGRLGVLAGFPWFGEWGRDVFLALPGLTLARGRPDLCAEVLRGALPFLRRGLLPNIYGKDVASSHYGSCDAALWFALAVQRFADAGHDRTFVQRELVPALQGIVNAYGEGTDLGLALTADGLLAAGGPELNATWMDARLPSGPVTPRQGLPVELQALWYSLLAFLAEQRPDTTLVALRDRCGAEFVTRFWLADTAAAGGEYLADRVHDGVADRKVRPNMLVAAALPRSPLSRPQRAAVVARAQAELVTPCGLRTLSPHDPDYVGRYGGGIEARDRAYHQGTVWPWLGGFFVEAALAAVPARARRKVAERQRTWLLGVLGELDRAGLDHVSEVFDGDPPHRPGGTFAQAWNSGELLRALALCDAVLGGAADDLAGGGTDRKDGSGG